MAPVLQYAWRNQHPESHCCTHPTSSQGTMAVFHCKALTYSPRMVSNHRDWVMGIIAPIDWEGGCHLLHDEVVTDVSRVSDFKATSLVCKIVGLTVDWVLCWKVGRNKVTNLLTRKFTPWLHGEFSKSLSCSWEWGTLLSSHIIVATYIVRTR